MTGYISGNLLISAICGVLTYAVLKVSGVGFAGLIALFVALADLIPLVGATLGAVVACIAAFLHSIPAGIAAVVFFVLYQQLENHLLQPMIFARTVKLNPLAVLIAVLLATELAGILGALLAIPVAGIIQVVLRDVWDHRRGHPNPNPPSGKTAYPSTRPPTPTTRPDCRPTPPAPTARPRVARNRRPARVRAERLPADPRQERVDDSPWRGGMPMARIATSSSRPSPKPASSSMSASTTSGARAGARRLTNCCNMSSS